MNKKRIAIIVGVLVLIALLIFFFLVKSKELIGGCGTVTDADGNKYKTVIIGDNCWMAENMKTTSGSDGSRINRYCYDDDQEKCLLYGGLYDWEAAMNVCPDGWVLPEESDWLELEKNLEMSDEDLAGIGWRESGEIGDRLKSENYCSHLDCNPSGFEAIMGGYRDLAGQYFGEDAFAYFWAVSESGPNAWSRHVRNDYSGIYRSTYEKEKAFSVRCLKENKE